MTALLLLALTALGSDREDLRRRLADFDANARYPLPALSDAQLDDLLAGRVVKVREVDPSGPQRVIGMVVTDRPKDALYVSAHDPHLSAVDDIHEVLLEPTAGVDAHRWVQLLDLPRPFADRHWVADVRDNADLHEATGGVCWEHWWTLAPDGPAIAERTIGAGKLPGVTLEMLAASVYVPTNTGAFFYVTLADGRTLFGFHAKSTVGGSIPDGLVASYTMATVGRVLRTVIDRVPMACAHYDADHAPLPGGHGAPLPAGCGS